MKCFLFRLRKQLHETCNSLVSKIPWSHTFQTASLCHTPLNNLCIHNQLLSIMFIGYRWPYHLYKSVYNNLPLNSSTNWGRPVPTGGLYPVRQQSTLGCPALTARHRNTTSWIRAYRLGPRLRLQTELNCVQIALIY